MITEKPNYLDKPELSLRDTTAQEVDILKMADPNKLDPESMRMDAVAKLDQVAGKDKGSKAYKEALAKLDENMAKLLEVKDYAVSKVKVKEVIERNKKSVKVGKELDAIFAASDFKWLKDFLGKKFTNVLLQVDRDVTLKNDGARLQKNIDGTMAKLSKSLDGYYESFLAKEGEDAVKKVKSSEEGHLSIADFDRLEDACINTKYYSDYGMDGSSKGKVLQEMAKQKYAYLKEVRKEAISKLSAYDRKIVLNYDAALAASKRKEKNAEQWNAGARETYLMTLGKSEAVAVKEKAAAYGLTSDRLADGDKAFIAAQNMEKRSPQAAYKLYQEARSAYELQVQIQIAMGVKPNSEWMVKNSKEAAKKKAEV